MKVLGVTLSSPCTAHNNVVPGPVLNMLTQREHEHRALSAHKGYLRGVGNLTNKKRKRS